MTPDRPLQAATYARCSTREQADSGLGIDAQRVATTAEVARRGWLLAEIVADEGWSAATMDRPGIRALLAKLDRREVDVLVVSRLDRLTRSVADFGVLADRAKRRGWSIVCLDLGLDTTSAAGELVANVIVSAAQYERRLVGLRTRDALAAARARGTRLGRPPTTPADTVADVLAQREAGSSLRQIAADLTARCIPTANGGSWQPSTVARIVRRAAREQAA